MGAPLKLKCLATFFTLPRSSSGFSFFRSWEIRRATAVSNRFLFSAGETDLVLRRLSEFFDNEGLWGTRTSDCERWKTSDEEKEGRVR